MAASIPLEAWTRGEWCIAAEAAGKKKAGCFVFFGGGTTATTAKMGSLRELQHALQEKKRRDENER